MEVQKYLKRRVGMVTVSIVAIAVTQKRSSSVIKSVFILSIMPLSYHLISSAWALVTRYYNIYRPVFITAEEQQVNAMILEEYESDVFMDDTVEDLLEEPTVGVEVNSRRIKTRRRQRYVYVVVKKCRMELGDLDFTRANELVVHRVGVRIMRKHGVRDTHIATCIDQVIALFFVPTKLQLSRQRFRVSDATQQRVVSDGSRLTFSWLAWALGMGAVGAPTRAH